VPNNALSNQFQTIEEFRGYTRVEKAPVDTEDMQRLHVSVVEKW